MPVMSDTGFVRTLKGEALLTPPLWLMRQAGRYLPEYRAVREKAGGFLEMVYHPERACDVTMQPVRRFGMDAAILFSDILVIPQALGQELSFAAGEGPRLGALDVDALVIDRIDDVLSPVYQTVAAVRQALRDEGFVDTALIGF